MRSSLIVIATFITLTSFAQTKVDLAITHAKLFNSKTGTIASDQIILVNKGIIFKVTNSLKGYTSKKTINAAGRLVTPAFIDTHIHPTDVYRTYGALPEYLPKDSLEVYRERISKTFLPYGITTAMIMGHSEKWLSPILSWHNDSRPDHLDLYTVGGALVSHQTRKPYINHAMVDSPLAARQKVLEYYNLGIRHIKLYWKLRKPEFEAAFNTADSLKMKVYAHVDQNVMLIDTALNIGVRNYEHLLTLVNSVWDIKNDGNSFNAEMQKYYGPGHANGQVERLEMFRFIHDKKPELLDALIDKLAQNKASFSTSIHLMAEPFGLTIINNKMDTTLNEVQLTRCRKNFEILMSYVKRSFVKGIKLRIGTDWPNGGQAFISEQLLLAEYGFSVADILKISTINGAEVLGLDDKYGTVEKGKNADLLIWDKNPFDNYKNFSATKTIIKDGVVYKN